jgi:hypothetical protein
MIVLDMRQTQLAKLDFGHLLEAAMVFYYLLLLGQL